MHYLLPFKRKQASFLHFTKQEFFRYVAFFPKSTKKVQIHFTDAFLDVKPVLRMLSALYYYLSVRECHAPHVHTPGQ